MHSRAHRDDEFRAWHAMATKKGEGLRTVGGSRCAVQWMMSDVCGFEILRHGIGMFLCVWLSAGGTKHIVLFPTTSRVFPVQRARVYATFFFHHTGS